MLELDDYQITAREFLAERAFAGLWDAPGVGKTAPSIDAAAQRIADSYGAAGPTLVTAPAYLLPNWEYEIGRVVPGATVALADGKGSTARHEALQSDVDFILTSYNNWSAGKGKDYEYKELVTRGWSAYIFDEAHRLRGRNSRTTKHVYRVRRRDSTNVRTPVWGLTGTPIVNNPGDLYPMFYLWDKRRFPSYWKFVNEWCDIVTHPWGTDVGQLRTGMEEAFQALLGEFALRRTLRDVPKLATLEEEHKHYHVTMPASVRKTIAEARQNYIIEHPDLGKSDFVSGGGALYAKLRMLATDPPTAIKPKIDLLSQLLVAEENAGPAVVYVWYKSSAHAVTEALTKSYRPVTLVTGDTPTDQRSAKVDEWKSQENGVLVATISSLKEGISLVNASSVIFIEHSELPADQEQCVARLKRRGQTQLVSVHHVWAKGTPDIAIKRAVIERETGLRRALTQWLEED